MVRAVLAFIAAALLLSNFILVFNAGDGSDSSSQSGKMQFARFLNAICLPLLLVGAVFAVTVFASVYIGRLALDLQHQADTRDDAPSAATRETGFRDGDDSMWRPAGR
jgi:hypothetical protein